MTTLAIDIGGTKLAAALIGADGQIRDRRELPTPASQTPEALRDALSALVSPLQAHAQRGCHRFNRNYSRRQFAGAESA